MPHAFAAVTAAIKHAGFAAVERLYFELKDGGKRAAYWLAQELRTLGPAPVPVPASPPAAAPTVPEVLPTEALGHVNEARLRISDALTNPPLWRRIVAAIEAIGLVPARQYEPHLVEKQLALALSRGQSVRT